MNQKKIVIWGANGFIGKNLSVYLKNSGHQVSGFGHHSNQIDYFNANNINFTQADFRDTDALRYSLEGCHTVFHLVGSSTPKSSNDYPSKDLANNLAPTLDLLDMCVKSGVKQVIFTSSGGTVYGAHNYLPIDEEHPTYPICAYGVTKLANEHYMRLYANLYAINMTVIRLANPYGPFQSIEKGQGIIGTYCQAIKNNQKLKVWGDGSVVRDYIHINDVVRAYASLITDTPEYKCLNLGTGIGTSINQLIDIFREISPRAIEIDSLPGRDVDVPKNVLDIKWFCSEYNWQPQISLFDGIKHTLDWHLKTKN